MKWTVKMNLALATSSSALRKTETTDAEAIWKQVENKLNQLLFASWPTARKGI